MADRSRINPKFLPEGVSGLIQQGFVGYHENFVRRDDSNIINSALNYGYAILRGCVARNIAATGLLPCFGIHHSNKLNQFNLVDDLMEIYRPFIDYVVASIDFSDVKELTPVLKNQLISTLTFTCYIGGQEIQILKAIEISAESLSNAICKKDFNLLKLPEFRGHPKLYTGAEQ